MVCQKCGKSLPSEGVICPFCGVMINKDQLDKRKKFAEKRFQAKLLSDKYGIDKTSIYTKKEPVKENKILGAIIILGILLFLIILVIIVNSGI